MKRYKLVMLLVLGSIVFSCTPKKNNLIAIDILLTPSEVVDQQALHLNALIKENNPSSMQLDKNHIPHITLLQGYVKEDDLPEIKKSLKGLFEIVDNENLYARSMVYNKETEDSFAMIQIENTEALSKIHIEAIARMKPFVVQNGSESAFVPNPDGSPIGTFTIEYVSNFIEKYSYDNFDPHISLGVAKKVFLDSLNENVFQPVRFMAPSLDLYQLGDSGTAQKQLWSSNSGTADQ